MGNNLLEPKSPSKTYGLMELVKGTSPMIGKGPENTVMSWPNLLIMEVIAVLITSVILLFWAAALDAPLRELANPDVTENPAKAPWYFLNLQELLLHMHPGLAGVILPSVVLLLLMAIPYMDRSQKDVGIWFASPTGKKVALWSVIFTAVVVPLLIGIDEYIRAQATIKPEIIPAWITPIGIIAGFSYLLYLSLKRWKPNTREVLIALFTGFVVSYFLLTISGTLFRGIGMRLTMPWELPPGALTF